MASEKLCLRERERERDLASVKQCLRGIERDRERYMERDRER